MTFGEASEALGLEAADQAKAAGVTPAYIYKLRKGLSEPTAPVANALAADLRRQNAVKGLFDPELLTTESLWPARRAA